MLNGEAQQRQFGGTGDEQPCRCGLWEWDRVTCGERYPPMRQNSVSDRGIVKNTAK